MCVQLAKVVTLNYQQLYSISSATTGSLCRCSSPVVVRVTSLEQLSVAEFSGEKARPKDYENGHKNVLAIWLDLASNDKRTWGKK